MKHQRKPTTRPLNATAGRVVSIISRNVSQGRAQVIMFNILGDLVTRHIHCDPDGVWWTRVYLCDNGDQELAQVVMP